MLTFAELNKYKAVESAEAEIRNNLYEITFPLDINSVQFEYPIIQRWYEAVNAYYDVILYNPTAAEIKAAEKLHHLVNHLVNHLNNKYSDIYNGLYQPNKRKAI